MSENTVEDLLQQEGVDVTEELMRILDKLGVKEISHLRFLKEQDFKDAGQ